MKETINKPVLKYIVCQMETNVWRKIYQGWDKSMYVLMCARGNVALACSCAKVIFYTMIKPSLRRWHSSRDLRVV